MACYAATQVDKIAPIRRALRGAFAVRACPMVLLLQVTFVVLPACFEVSGTLSKCCQSALLSHLQRQINTAAGLPSHQLLDRQGRDLQREAFINTLVSFFVNDYATSRRALACKTLSLRKTGKQCMCHSLPNQAGHCTISRSCNKQVHCSFPHHLESSRCRGGDNSCQGS